jgi:osmotically-inducible protein OsmY
MKNELELQQDVLAELDSEQTHVNSAIGVEVHHGVVKLAGRVSNYAIRENSERAARRVDGVTSVIMDIDVAGNAPPTAGEMTRETRVI